MKRAETRLADARAAQAETVGRIAEVEAAAPRRISDEDDAAAPQARCASSKSCGGDSRIGADRVRLLEQQAKDEEQAAVLQRRNAHVHADQETERRRSGRR